ncbi:hypothetical protein N9L47_08685 [Rhodobacteraceae bacterium]|nr:hypothetical protein [Paracoccaceae bacterium]
MDLGLWATWYDMDEENKTAYLEWAHRIYLPYLRVMPGVSWVAHYANEGGGPRMDDLIKNVVGRTDADIGHGSQFVILVGAVSPHTFFNPYIPDVVWPDGFQKMIDMQLGRRSAILVEAHRVTGPDGGNVHVGGPPGPYIQMGSFCMSNVEKDFEIGKWYAQHRLPYMAQMPGCIATRKYVGVAGWAKHAILYEFTSAEARLKRFEVDHETHDLDAETWHTNVIPFTRHTPGSPVIGPRLWPPIG